MPEEENNVQKLEGIRDKLATIYKDEATDDIHDNGNLSHLHKAIAIVEDLIVELKKRRT